jgi:hypothetical protein
MTVKHGGQVPELPAGMRELSRLSAIEYKPNLEDGRRRICWFYIFYSLFQLKGTVTLHENYNVRLAFKSTVMIGIVFMPIWIRISILMLIKIHIWICGIKTMLTTRGSYLTFFYRCLREKRGKITFIHNNESGIDTNPDPAKEYRSGSATLF